MSNLFTLVFAAGIIVLVFIFGQGCVNDALLNRLETTTQKVQPVINKAGKVCEVALKETENNPEVLKACNTFLEAVDALQLAQEVAIIAAGGEPCSNGCD